MLNLKMLLKSWSIVRVPSFVKMVRTSSLAAMAATGGAPSELSRL